MQPQRPHAAVICVYCCRILWLHSHQKAGSVRSAAQSYLTLRNPMACSPPGSSVPWIFQARILEWVAISCFTWYLYPLPLNLGRLVTNSMQWRWWYVISKARWELYGSLTKLVLGEASHHVRSWITLRPPGWRSHHAGQAMCSCSSLQTEPISAKKCEWGCLQPSRISHLPVEHFFEWPQ